uniref:uncharacterized protein LOC104266431 isoform X2 n=1 Tax=Ciona intestinalis TaxID=7719 RepID=UPI00089DC5E0|nr:uncharacterized protein LOC104266431 isoform X2 [Ciona intestinalis]|eukprot:XP_018670300.1 uncharacterized protein LOC104266431 isoform X2 [Ciona intestinalis]
MTHFVLLLIVLLIRSSFGQNDEFRSLGDSDSSAAYADAEYSNEPASYTAPPGEFERFRETFNVLFESPSVANEKVFNRLTDPLLMDYWTWDDIGHCIATKANERDTSLSESQLVEVREAIELIEEKKVEAIRPGGNLFFESMNDSRSPLDCEIGHFVTNEYYTNITKSVERAWNCYRYLPALWLSVIKANKKTCSLKDAMTSVVEVGQTADHPQEPNNPRIVERNSKLLYTISKPENLNYIKKYLCPHHEVSTCTVVENVICKPGYSAVLQLTEQLQNASQNSPPSDSTEMFVLLDLQSTLGEISNEFNRTETKSASAAKDMLNFYMGIVDNTIGNKGVEVWKNMPLSRSENELEKLLEKNENFVGGTSDKILGPDTSRVELEKETLSVKMVTVNGEGNVEFGFPGAQIWTENIPNVRSSDKLNAYALYYKSWRDIQSQIRGSPQPDTNPNGRWFVGKGGVISLSTRKNKEKKSVPVTYKMKFDNESDVFTSSDSITRRCLSCEYYDVTSNTWQSSGCYAKGADTDGITCTCNHTTNFAAFMSPFDADFTMSEEQATWLNAVEYAGSALSVVCLVASFITFCLVRSSVRNDRLRAHINLVVALFFVHSIQLGADYAVFSESLCVTITLLTHYFLLAAFMWMFVEGVFLYLYVVQVFVHSRFESRWWMYALGWGTPLIIVAVSAGYGIPNEVYVQRNPPTTPPCQEGQIPYPPLPYNPKEGLKYATCWLDVTSGMTWSFIAPALAVILFNIVILCKVVQVLVKLSERTKGMKSFKATNAIGAQHHVKQGYQMKQKPSSQVPTAKVTEFKTPPIRYGRSNSDDVSTQELHGNEVTGFPSRSSSQTYSQNFAVGRPRTATVSSFDETNYLSDIKTAIKGAAVLLPVLGIPWICGMLGYKSFALTIGFVVLNSIQGVAIFLVYCVFNDEVCRALKRLYQVHRMKHGVAGRGRTSSTSSLKSAFNRGLLRSWRRRSTAISTVSTSNNV